LCDIYINYLNVKDRKVGRGRAFTIGTINIIKVSKDVPVTGHGGP
jgi:hypothetical protein